MSTITKEWLQKAISQYEIMRDESPDGLNEYDSNELAALRIALASLEAEVVGYVDAEYAELLKSGHIESCSVYAEPGEGGITVFSAPPAPVSVPDEATPENIEILASTYAPCGVTYQWDRDECNAAADSWNACRAAMLQGAENAETPTTMQTAPALDSSPKISESPSGNSPVIPDGYVLVPVEPTEDMIIHGFESEPDESFSDEKEWEAYEAMSGCQQAAHRAKLCWAAMIAAAQKAL